MKTAAGNEPGRRVAVVVVHGVGNNQPGSTVNTVVDAVCGTAATDAETTIRHRRRIAATPENEVFMLAEPRSDWQQVVENVQRTDTGKRRPDPKTEVPVSDVPRFPVYSRQVALPRNGTAEFYELHWADLARTGNSWWGTVGSFARFVFEIPHVIDGFLREAPGPYSRLLRRLLLLATCFVRGPLAGYTAVMLIGGLIFLSFSWIPEREDVTAVVAIGQERAWHILSFLIPPAGIKWLEGHYANLPAAHSRIWILAWMGGILISAVVIWWFSRKSVRLKFFAAFLWLASAFYLVDAIYLRPERYASYKGIVYLDYMSVSLFAVFMAGLFIFWTRRIKEVGFADLGLFIAIWSAFFIAHMSPLGDVVRLHLFNGVPIFETTVATPSSKVHFEAFSLYYPILAVLWVVWAVLMLIAFAMTFLLYAFNWRNWNRRYRGLFAALGLAVVQSCVWLTAIPGLGVMHMDDVLCRGAANYASRPLDEPVSCQAKLQVNSQAIELFRRLNVEPDQTMAGIPSSLRAEIAEAVRARFSHTLDFDMLKAMRELSLAFLWNGFVLVSAACLTVAIALYRHLKAHWFGRNNGRVRLPRLIVNNGVLALLLLFGVINIAFAFTRLDTNGQFQEVLSFLGLGVFHDGLSFFGLSADKQRDVPAGVVRMAIMTTTLAILVTQIPSIMTPLSGVLQIMQGLIDHHYRVGVSIAPRFLTSRRQTPIRREHISQRLHEIVTRTIAGKRYDDIIFIAHSQGTIIVFDYLTSPAARVLGKPVHVVTAGSPLGALYAHYFNEYDRVEERITKLSARTKSWTNLYRLDDPIAGPIAPPPRSRRKAANAPPSPAFLRDQQLPPGGHLRYWKEPEVCDVIRNLLLNQPAPPAPSIPQVPALEPVPTPLIRTPSLA